MAPPFRAERLVIHPLTRVVRSAEGGVRVETHFELLDRYGISVRELGEVEFEARVGADDRAETLWRKDLRTGEANAAQFDRITGMYGAALEFTERSGVGGGRLTLNVRFRMVDGRVLTASWREAR